METKVWNDMEVVVTPDYTVIGSGPMIDSPSQIGEWWCVPLEMYDKDIPAEGIERMAEILKSEIVVGLIIADDIRNVKPMPEKKAVSIDKSELISMAGEIVTIGVTVMVGMAAIMLSVLAYDPMIIAILEDESWIQCYSWYE